MRNGMTVRRSKRLCKHSVAALVFMFVGCHCEARAEPTKILEYNVPRNFIGKDGKAAKDLSGMACAPGLGVRTCLVINDEGGSAQWATIDGTSLIAGAELPLIGTSIDDGILGAKPELNCPNGEGNYGELDGEAVAFSSPYYYVVGSHGCSRKKSKFRSSSFILARVSEAGLSVATTFRLADVLRQAGQVGAFFGKDLNSGNGLNIEGLAVQGNKLIVGLRAPSINGQAFLVRTELAPLFAEGRTSATPNAEVIGIAVPKGAGIRDLATLPDGSLLVLLGPAQDQLLPFSFLRINLPETAAPTTLQGESLGKLPEVGGGGATGKAEAISVLNVTARELDVIVLFDSLKNGAPHKYRITLP
jgi:hypothetical protein